MNLKDKKLITILVIIPALNEEKSIQKVIQKLPELSRQNIQLTPVVIDDGSTDDTAAIAKECGAILITHETNMGVGKCFHDGLAFALEYGADIMVNIDADLQYDPADITKLIQPILENKADFVTADRFINEKGEYIQPENMSAIKFHGNQIMTKLVNSLAGTKLGDVSSGFRAINREAILNLNLSGKYTYTHETIIDLGIKGLRQVSIPIKVIYFQDRKSRVAGNLLNYIQRALRIIFKSFRDYKPFYFFGLLSFAPMILGLAAMIFMIIYFLVTGDFSPYKFVGFIGVYLFSLAVILLIIGFLADILVGIRITSEKQLYLLKKRNYDKE